MRRSSSRAFRCRIDLARLLLIEYMEPLVVEPEAAAVVQVSTVVSEVAVLQDAARLEEAFDA